MKIKAVAGTFAGICIASLSPHPDAWSESLPLWEAGIGAAAVSLPDYRGSDVRHTRALPLPYIVYRGKYLRADRGGIRAFLFESDKVDLNLSLHASLGGSSDDNPARAGMPDLRPVIEIGPNLNLHLWRSADQKMRMDFRVPVRAGITVESSPRHIGWLFSPNLFFGVQDPAGLKGWTLGMNAGPVFQSRKYNAHYYSVSASEATPSRPAFSAAGGYAGSQLSLSMSRRFERIRLIGFARVDSLRGASFADSPLIRQNNAVSVGIAVAWIFGESSTRVDMNDTEQ